MIELLRRPVFLWSVALAALWLPVIYLLGAQWTFYQQYHYGWAVPFACVFFAWRRMHLLPAAGNGRWSGALFLLCVFGLIYWFSRVVQEANPLWRAASYGLVISAGTITLLFVYLAGGESWVRRFLFPVAFFLIAVPWPTRLEGALIQALTRLDTSAVVELLGFFGIPALMHGDVIELTHGAVGVEEACSGIRSVQATLMITLFFGEFFHFNGKKRMMLLAGGTFLAVILNVCRTFFLAWVTARFGGAMTERWHDPAGVFAFACFLTTWLLALFLRRKVKSDEQGMGRVETSPGSLLPAGGFPYLLRMAMTVVVCVAFVEISTEAWFRAHEKRGQPLKWAARWPEGNPSYQSRPVSADVREILRFDESAEANWTDPGGRDWIGFYFHWFPATTVYGRMKVALAKSHSPDVCLQAHGWTLQSELVPRTTTVGQGLNLRFRRYSFEQNGRTIYVFFAIAEDGSDASEPGLFGFSHWDRIRAAVAGSRNFGERSVEVAATGFDSAEDAWQAFQAALPGWIEEKGAGGAAETIAQNQ